MGRKNYDVFAPDGYYHVYSHANGIENLFRNADNYHYFLIKYRQHISQVAETIAYCLMPNHIHFLVKIRSEEVLRANYAKKYPQKMLPQNPDWATFTMQYFKNWLNAYTKAYNKYYQRKGGLFLKFTKRKHVASDDYFTHLIIYIHRNPIHHGFVNCLTDWRYTSYAAILSDEPTNVARQIVLDHFGGKAEFVQRHEGYLDPPPKTSEGFPAYHHKNR